MYQETRKTSIYHPGFHRPIPGCQQREKVGQGTHKGMPLLYDGCRFFRIFSLCTSPGILVRSLCCCLFFLLAACASSTGAPSASGTGTSTPPASPTKAVTPTENAPTLSAALVTYKGHSGPVVEVAWSPDGKWLASCGNDGTVQVWNARTGSMRWQSSVDRYTFAVAWSPNGTKIASGGDDKLVRLWNATTGQTELVYRGHSDIILKVAWSSDGKYIASASADGTVQVWQPQV